MGVLDTLRRWVDGDEGEDALSRAAAEQARPRRQAEEFIAEIARAIGEVMHNEAVPLPPDQTVIPPEYIVFLSEDDDRDWQGVKRKALEQGLHHVLAEHARDLAGKTRLATSSFSVELRVDGTLSKGEIRVQHSWEESSSSNKTSITPRQRPNQPKSDAPRQPAPPPTPLTNNDNAQPQFAADNLPADSQSRSSLVPATVLEKSPPSMPAAAVDKSEKLPPVNASGALDYDATRVNKRELYRLEVWRDNLRQLVIPVFKEEISIGRKSNKIASDIQLDGDPEISRPHALLRRDAEGNFWLTHKGKNPTVVAGREMPAEQPQPLIPGEPIVICSYLLRVAA